MENKKITLMLKDLWLCFDHRHCLEKQQWFSQRNQASVLGKLEFYHSFITLLWKWRFFLSFGGSTYHHTSFFKRRGRWRISYTCLEGVPVHVWGRYLYRYFYGKVLFISWYWCKVYTPAALRNYLKKDITKNVILIIIKEEDW